MASKPPTHAKHLSGIRESKPEAPAKEPTFAGASGFYRREGALLRWRFRLLAQKADDEQDGDDHDEETKEILAPTEGFRQDEAPVVEARAAVHEADEHDQHGQVPVNV